MSKQETDAYHDQGGEITGAEGTGKQEEKTGKQYSMCPCEHY